jgi:hypothetical protein
VTNPLGRPGAQLEWHPSISRDHLRQDCDLPGPFWADIWARGTSVQAIPCGYDPAAWGWAVHDDRLPRGKWAAAGDADSEGAARQAVAGWLAAQPPLGPGWPLWNVVVPVVALLRGETPAGAQGRLAKALRSAGFDVLDGGTTVSLDVLEAEEQDAPESAPPPAGWPW